MTGRKSWDEYFMGLAEYVAERSTCNRIHVGCVIVKDNLIVSAGYNGSLHGHPHCTDAGCLIKDGKCMRTIHAEENAILHTHDRKLLKGATIYTTHEPCDQCTKKLNQVGIGRVVYLHDYPNEYNKLFVEGMKWEKYAMA